MFNTIIEKYNTFKRYIKYDNGYSEEKYFPYIIKLSESENPIPYDVWKMTKYSVKENLIILEHLRTQKETKYTFKEFVDNKDMLDIGRTQSKTSNGWYRIQLLEALQKSDLKIQLPKNSKIKIKGKYSTTKGLLDKETTFHISKTNPDNAFVNWDWLSVTDEDGTKIQIYFYDIIKFYPIEDKIELIALSHLTNII